MRIIKCYDQRVRSNSVFISIDTSNVFTLVSRLVVLCAYCVVKFDDLYFSVCGDVKRSCFKLAVGATFSL